MVVKNSYHIFFYSRNVPSSEWCKVVRFPGLAFVPVGKAKMAMTTPFGLHGFNRMVFDKHASNLSKIAQELPRRPQPPYQLHLPLRCDHL